MESLSSDGVGCLTHDIYCEWCNKMSLCCTNLLSKMKSRQNSTFIHWIPTMNLNEEVSMKCSHQTFLSIALKGTIFFRSECLLFLPNDKQKRYSSIIELSYFVLVTKVCRDDIFVVWNWLEFTLTSPSEKHSGLHTIQVLGVWSASPEDKSSDKRSCNAENIRKTHNIPDTSNAHIHQEWV